MDIFPHIDGAVIESGSILTMLSGGFDYETKEFFRSTMIQQANPLRLKAIGAYKSCLDKSRELQWFNKWTDLAEQQIAKINPEEFSYSIEERGQPSHFHQTKIFKALVLDLPVEEDE